MKIKSFPNNRDEYSGAEWIMRWFHGRTSGIYAPGEGGGGVVSAVDGRMEVTLSDCLGWLSNSKGDGIVWWNDSKESTGSPLVFGVPAAHGMLNRIDRIVVSWDISNYAELPEIMLVKGTPAGNAKPPVLENSGVRRQISLAQISVPAGTIKITPGLITDERFDPDVCGLVTESITADTGMVSAQFRELLALLKSQINQAASGALLDGSVSTVKIQDGAVTEPKLAPELLAKLLAGAGGVKFTSLWKNAKPNSAFAAQKISLKPAYSQQDLFMVVAKYYTGGYSYVCSPVIVSRDQTGMISTSENGEQSSTYIATRRVDFKTAGKATFTVGVLTTDGTAALNNESAIPLEIWGIKL